MKAKRSELIRLIRDLRRCVVVEASGGEGEKNVNDVVLVLRRADIILSREAAEETKT